MGLINLYTDLKSLKFGKDRIGGGSSNQPYIRTPIPEKIGEFGYLNQDFILRGGSKALTDSVSDVVRLSKYFTDLRNPSGLLFTVKQNLLSRMAVRTQASVGILNEGIYTPLSTLIEAGGSAFGLHVNKQGLNPFGGLGGIKTYSEEIYANQVDKDQAYRLNRLYQLYDVKIQNNFNIYTGNSVSPLNNNILTYKGGPGAFLGIGSTNIKFADQRTGLNNPNYGKNRKYQARNKNTDINYNHALGLSVSSSFSDSLKLPTQTGINELGQVLRDSGSYFYNGYLASEEIKNNISQPYTFEGASIQYPREVNNLLVLTSSPSSKTGIGSNWYYSVGGGGLGVTNVGIGGILNDYSTTPEPQSGFPIGTVTGTDTGDNATYTKDDLLNDEYTPTYRINRKIQDFRNILRSRINGVNDNSVPLFGPNATNILSSAPDYSGPNAKNIEKRVGLGDPGYSEGKNLKSYANGGNPGQIVGYSGGNASITSYDKINALPIYSDSTPDEKNGNDLVKFRIGVIDNDNPSKKTYIHFRAFLNQITDGYTAEWNGTKYIGRGENFYTYGGFDRKVSLSWTVAAQSKAELIPMYKKLNYLASICTPDYSANGYMRGNIVTLTVGGYFYEQPGIINGFSYDMNDDNATWEIGINDEGVSDHTVKELPHVIKVNGFSFTPIHTFVPRKQMVNYNPEGDVLTDKNTYGKERYIALDQGTAEYNNYGPIATYPQPDPVPAPKPNPPAPPNPNPVVAKQEPALLAAPTYLTTPVTNGKGGAPTVVVNQTYSWGIDPNKKVTIDTNGKTVAPLK